MEAVVAFDLDDTLYKEMDFVKSAFSAIADALGGNGCDRKEVYDAMLSAFKESRNPIDEVISGFRQPFSEKELVDIYRYHKPAIFLADGARDVLAWLKGQGFGLALITDGRVRTQYNKVEALHLTDYIPEKAVVVSEAAGHDKTDPDNFIAVQNLYEGAGKFVYVGDNPAKDFFQPNRLGWGTVCLKDDGRNIRPQDIDCPAEALPQYVIEDISSLPRLIMKILKN